MFAHRSGCPSSAGEPTIHPGSRPGIGAPCSTIDKYIYVTLRRLPSIFNFNYRVAWRIIEEHQSISEIQHPIVRTVLQAYGVDDTCGYEILYNADLPAQSGLGSSSAFTVSMLRAYLANLGISKPKDYFAREAIRIEQDLLNEPVGSQDQVAAAYGGLNRIDFHPGGEFRVEPVIISPDRKRALNDNLLMFFTGFTRSASAIESEKIGKFGDKTAELEAMYSMVDEGVEILQDASRDLGDFGRLMHRGWMMKRSLSGGVSNPTIDEAYDAAIQAGAVGGKLLGAGGGGFLMFYVDKQDQDAVREALAPMLCMRFGFENYGSSVVLYNPDLTSNYDVSAKSL